MLTKLNRISIGNNIFLTTPPIGARIGSVLPTGSNFSVAWTLSSEVTEAQIIVIPERPAKERIINIFHFFDGFKADQKEVPDSLETKSEIRGRTIESGRKCYKEPLWKAENLEK